MKLLIAEDEPDIIMPYKIALEHRNHEPVIAYNDNDCLRAFRFFLFIAN